MPRSPSAPPGIAFSNRQLSDVPTACTKFAPEPSKWAIPACQKHAWAPKASRDLARLVVPIHDAIDGLHLATDRVGTLGNKQSYASARLRCTWPILRHVHVSGRVYWDWSDQDWCTLIEPSARRAAYPRRPSLTCSAAFARTSTRG